MLQINAHSTPGAGRWLLLRTELLTPCGEEGFAGLVKYKCEPKFDTREVRREKCVKVACQIDDTLCFFLSRRADCPIEESEGGIA